MSSFENNFGHMVVDISQDGECTRHKCAHAMYYLMETVTVMVSFFSNFKKGLYYTVTDVTNLVGLGTMGIGLIGKSGGSELTKVGFKEALKRIVMSKT